MTRRPTRHAVVPLVTLAIIAGLLAGCGHGKPRDTLAERVTAQLHGIHQQGIALGNPRAPLTMVEFADLKCPYCRRFNDNILPTLIDEYVRPGKLRIVFRNVAILNRFTTRPESSDAALMAGAMTLQNRLWNFADLFYLNQGDETTSYVTDDFLRGLAERVPGTDVGRAMADRKNPLARNFMVIAMRRFAAIGMPGTPTFLIERKGRRTVKLATPSLEDATAWIPVIERLLP